MTRPKELDDRDRLPRPMGAVDVSRELLEMRNRSLQFQVASQVARREDTRLLRCLVGAAMVLSTVCAGIGAVTVFRWLFAVVTR